jgi:ribonuclease Y
VNNIEYILIFLAFGAVSAVIGIVIGRLWTERQQAEKMLEVTESGEARLVSLQEEQRKALLEAKDESAKIRSQLETEARERRQDLKSQQQRLTQKEEEYDRKLDQIEKRDRQISQRVAELDQQKAALEELRAQRLTELQRVSQLTIEEARAEVIRAAFC